MTVVFLKRRFATFVGAISLMLIFMGCDGPHQPIEAVAPKAGRVVQFDEVLKVVSLRCVRCHASGTNDWSQESNLERVARSGELSRRLESRTMPQPGSPEAQAITPSEVQMLLVWAAGFAESAPLETSPEAP